MVAGVKDRVTGQAITRVVAATDAVTLLPFVENTTVIDATVFSDGAKAYQNINRPHHSVDHGVGEYARGMAHMNGIESMEIPAIKIGRMAHRLQDLVSWLNILRQQNWEQDPRREWLGFRAEFDKLLSGQHPDPHPEKIILGKEMDNFDPTTIQTPRGEILICDNDAFNDLRDSKQPINGYPAGSQQAYAYLCGKYMEDCLKNGTTDEQPPVQRTPVE